MSQQNLERPVMALQPDDWTDDFSCMMCGRTRADLVPYPPGMYRCEGCGQRYWPTEKTDD